MGGGYPFLPSGMMNNHQRSENVGENSLSLISCQRENDTALKTANVPVVIVLQMQAGLGHRCHLSCLLCFPFSL